jgi:hypothetical protein
VAGESVFARPTTFKPVTPGRSRQARTGKNSLIGRGMNPADTVSTHQPGKGSRVFLDFSAGDAKAKEYVAGAQAELFIMFKEEPATPGTDGGWVYGTVIPDLKRVTSTGRVASCLDGMSQTGATRPRLRREEGYALSGAGRPERLRICVRDYCG